MKNLILGSIITGGAFFFTGTDLRAPAPERDLGVTINHGYSKASTLDSILRLYTKDALPGASLAVYSETEGWWASAAGYADKKTQLPMDNYHVQYLQSVSKMFMATEILQLKEQGKIRLDDPMTKYLPEKYSRFIKEKEGITVRMLLNHTSGIPEYNSHPDFVSDVFRNPLKCFTAEDCLKSISEEKADFPPGSRYTYTNTNYLLLALIGDAITGDHARYMEDHLFKPADMRNVYYGNGHNYLKHANLPESYWDIFNMFKPTNVTGFQKMTVLSSKGDDGIVCTTVDAIKFLKAIIEGKLLQPESMKEMFDFVKDEKGRKRYGMGMIYSEFEGVVNYGHGGGGVGAGCGLVYIPSKKIYAFFSTNVAVLFDGDLPNKAGQMRDAIMQTLCR